MAVLHRFLPESDTILAQTQALLDSCNPDTDRNLFRAVRENLADLQRARSARDLVKRKRAEAQA
jgi:hypothetical protein